MDHPEAVKKFEQLIKLVKELGWTCSFDASDSKAPVEGLIIGRVEYVERILAALERDRKENGH